MSVIIRLQGLPWSASAMDIRNFFTGLSIPPGGVRIIGGDNGDAFIAFSTDEDARRAMMMTNKMLNDCIVQLFLSSKTEMQNTITQAKVKPVSSVPQATAPPASNAPLSVASALSQIPSVQQISQAFPAVGQIIGQLGIGQPPAQINQFPNNLQNTLSQSNINQPPGMFNVNNQAPKERTRFEEDLPGEYSIGGIQSANNRPNVQKQYGQGETASVPFINNMTDNMNRGFPPVQQNTLQKGHFHGDVYALPGQQQQNQPMDSDNRQHNINQNNQNMPFGNTHQFPNQSGNLPGLAGHGKPFHAEPTGQQHQQYGHGKSFPGEASGNLANHHQFGHGKPFEGDASINVPNQQFGPGKPFKAGENQPPLLHNPIHNRQNAQNMRFPLNERQNEPPFNHPNTLQDRNYPPVRQGDLNIGNVNIPPRNHPSRFDSPGQSTQSNYPPRSHPNEPEYSKVNHPKSGNASRPNDIRDNFQQAKPAMETKPNTLTSSMLSNRRDEFGRNLPYIKDGNLNDESRTPTQDEKLDEQRSSESRSRDSGRRSSRDRSRERSGRRDSRERDRRDRDRDRSRRDRDDDRRSRRDRDRDRERDRRPRDRESDRFDRSRDVKDSDIRKNSPSTDASRKTKKRSLSPSSKVEKDNEKKQQTEKFGHATANKSIDNKDGLNPSDVPVSEFPFQRDNPIAMSISQDKASTGSQPLFPVIAPQTSGRGLLGEAPPNLRPIPPPSINNGPNNPGIRKQEPPPAAMRGPLLNTPNANVRPPLLQKASFPLNTDNLNFPSEKQTRDGMTDHLQSFDHGHLEEGIVQGNKDVPFENRPELPGPHGPRFNGPPQQLFGHGRGIPPPMLMDGLQRPRLSRGPNNRFGTPERPFNEQPPEGRFRDGPFDDRHPSDFRGPPQDRVERDRDGPFGDRRPPDFRGHPQTGDEPARDGPFDDCRRPDFRGNPQDGELGREVPFDDRRPPGFRGPMQGREGPNRDGHFDDRRPPDFRGPAPSREGPNRDGPFEDRRPPNFRGPPQGREGPNRDGPFDDRRPPDFRGPRHGRQEPAREGPFDDRRPPFRGQLQGREEQDTDGSFDERRPTDFRGHPQGRGPIPPYGERNTETRGRMMRPSLLGDGGPPPPSIRGFPGDVSLRDGPQFNERGPPMFHRELGENFSGDFDDRQPDAMHGMPGHFEEMPAQRTRHDFQEQLGRDIPQCPNDSIPNFRGGPPFVGRQEDGFHGVDNQNQFRPQMRDDGMFNRNDGPNDIHGPADFRGHDIDDRRNQEFREPGGGRGFSGPEHNRINDTRNDQPGNRHNFRNDDSNRSQMDRDRDRRNYENDRSPRDHDLRNVERNNRYESRDNRPQSKYQDSNNQRDRSIDRQRGEHRPRDDNRRDERKREPAETRSGRSRQPAADDRRSGKGSERSSDKTPSSSEEKGTTKSRTESDRNGEKNNDLKTENQTKEDKIGTALCSVVLDNLPTETTYKDIRKLFTGLELPKDGIKIINDVHGKRIGKAYVRFGSQESFKKGILKDRTRIGSKNIVVKPVPRREFDSVVDSYLPPTENDEDDTENANIDVCNSLTATLRALKGEPELKVQKKGSASKDLIVKISMLPEYVRQRHIKTFFKDLNISQNGEAIYIEPGQLTKPCSGLCYVEFDDENSFKKAMTMRKVFERKTIHIEKGSKAGADAVIKQIKTESDKRENESKKGNIDQKKTPDIKSSKVEESKNTEKSDVAKSEVPKSPASSSSSQSTYLRVRNIPKTMRTYDLKDVFESSTSYGVKVAQICHDAVGKAVGEGFIELNSAADASQCLKKDSTYIGSLKISVKPVTKLEMIDTMRMLRQSLQPEVSTSKAVYFFVKASNLPKNVSTGEIMNFLSGYNPAPESIRLNIGDGTEPSDSSAALVGFRDREEAETAIQRVNGNLLRNNNVTLTKVIV